MGLSLLRPQQNDLAVSLCFKLLLLNGPIVPKSCNLCAKKMHVLFPTLCVLLHQNKSHYHSPTLSVHSSPHKKCRYIIFFHCVFKTFFLLFSAVMEFQVQINNVKAKLQDTRARKKQQELLIMKVENQALKVSSKCTFPPPTI